MASCGSGGQERTNNRFVGTAKLWLDAEASSSDTNQIGVRHSIGRVKWRRLQKGAIWMPIGAYRCLVGLSRAYSYTPLRGR